MLLHLCTPVLLELVTHLGLGTLSLQTTHFCLDALSGLNQCKDLFLCRGSAVDALVILRGGTSRGT